METCTWGKTASMDLFGAICGTGNAKTSVFPIIVPATERESIAYGMRAVAYKRTMASIS
jgi:hypothetical protein